jgi:hypothetical protein
MSNLPVSEQFRIAAKQWVEADAAANLMEETKSAVLSQRMAALGDVPVSRAELTVKASAEWEEFVVAMVEARRLANLLKVKIEWLRMKFQEQSSEEATRRAEIRLTQ